MKKYKTHDAYFEKYKFRISKTTSRNINWKHNEIEKTPELTYEGAMDEKQEGRVVSICQTFWQVEDENGTKNLEKYERDLKESIAKAIDKVNNGWQKRFAKEIEEI